MKPKDLKAPHSFEERRPVVQDRIFFIPDYYHDYQSFTLPSWKEIFGNENPVHVEYCSGNGEWILRNAERSPHINWVAVELKFDRVRKIHSKRTNLELSNLFIVCGKAQVFTREYLRESSIEATYVNFPDPWPKDRHAKHRLIQAPFMKDVFRAIKPGGESQFVSDAYTYIKQMQEEIESVPGWRAATIDPKQKEEYGGSYFERLWRSKGRDIHFLEYRCEK